MTFPDIDNIPIIRGVTLYALKVYPLIPKELSFKHTYSQVHGFNS